MRSRRSPKHQPLAPGAAERLNAIVEAAERAAQSVIDDAEAQARRYLEEARAEADRTTAERRDDLEGTIEGLLADATALRDGAARLVDALHAAQERLGGADGAVTRDGEGGPDEPAPPRLAAVEHLRPAPGPTSGEGSGAGARLLATQMAVSGSSREEIAQRLRNEFGIEDTRPILDAILGAED